MTDTDISDIRLHKLKKIEVIVKGDRQPFIRDLFSEAGITGYTLIKDVSGLGHHGFHEGRLLFNDQASLVMFMAVATPRAINKVVAGLKPLFEKSSGIMVLSDVEVVRLEHFTAEQTA
ncbi:MAG: DUF190 domain-containing protein [Rhodothalassiaceae bacterium]